MTTINKEPAREASVEAATTSTSTTSSTSRSGVWVGIDWGTTHSTAAVWDSQRGSPKWIRLGLHHLARKEESKEGRIVPSQVRFAFVSSKEENLGVFESVDDEILPGHNHNSNHLHVAVGAAAANNSLWKDLILEEDEEEEDYYDDAVSLISSVKRVWGVQRVSEVDHTLLASLPFTLLDKPPSSLNESGERTPGVLIPVRPIRVVQKSHDKEAATKDDDKENQQEEEEDSVLYLEPVDVAAILLRSMRLAIDAYLSSHKIQKKKKLQIPGGHGSAINVVLGVPASWNWTQRCLLMKAAQRAGFSGHVGTVTESTAAAMAYGLAVATTSTPSPPKMNESSNNKKKVILVFDMGGGTTDVTIAETAAVNNPSENDADDHGLVVQITHGNGHLGGDDMDQALANHVWHKLQQQRGEEETSVTLSPTQQRALVQECRRAKEALCGNGGNGDAESTDAVSSTTVTCQGCAIRITTDELNTVLKPILNQVRSLVQEALDRYKAHRRQQQQKRRAKAQAGQSAQTNEKDDESTAVFKMDEVILIGGATRVPAVRQVLRDLFPPPPDLCLSVHAMSAVAQGAAIRAALESKCVPLHEIRSALMLDTTPHAIGVAMNDDEETFIEVIPRDAQLPASGYATFYLANFRQPGVTIKAVEYVGNDNDKERPVLVPMGDFTFLLHRLSDAELARLDGKRAVVVGMHLEESGALNVSIFDENDPEHVLKRELYQKTQHVPADLVLFWENMQQKKEEGTVWESIGLVLVCVGLFFLYIAVKLVFHEPSTDSSILP